MTGLLHAPFPWFGGKSRAASIVWAALGDVRNYVEPFAGSLAVLLARPSAPHVETVNDLDCYVANFWRAVHADPDAVARWADSPVNEADLHARHEWLRDQAAFRESMKSDPSFFDVKIAGWWVWGLCAWIGDGWCSVAARKLPLIHNSGVGVHRSSLRQLPHVDGAGGKGVHRASVSAEALRTWMVALCERLRFVRVACGDWTRVVSNTVLRTSPMSGGIPGAGLTGVLLDPPYADGNMQYSAGGGVSDAVRAWAVEHGDDPRLRIVLCGYEGEHSMPSNWRSVAWKARGGYGSAGNGKARENAARERLWLSPACLDSRASTQLVLGGAP